MENFLKDRTYERMQEYKNSIQLQNTSIVIKFNNLDTQGLIHQSARV